MYMSADEVKTMLGIIRDNFDNAYVCMETLCPLFVKKRRHREINKSHRCNIYLGHRQI